MSAVIAGWNMIPLVLVVSAFRDSISLDNFGGPNKKIISFFHPYPCLLLLTCVLDDRNLVVFSFGLRLRANYSFMIDASHIVFV